MSTSKDCDLSLWEQNFAQIPSVQGESESRTINFHLKEEVSTQDDLGNLEIRQKPFDATGYSARLYIEKTDGTKVFFDGTISDATNGIVSFILPYQATTVSGSNIGTIYLSKPDGTVLKAIGITINVVANDLEGSIESTNEFSALVTALNEVNTAAAEAQQAATNTKQAVSDANAAISSADTATQNANDAAQSANASAGAANQAAQNAESLYQMVNPLTGQIDYTTNIIDQLTQYIFKDAITAQEFDNLNITAQDFDNKNIIAKDFDTSAKAILGGT